MERSRSLYLRLSDDLFQKINNDSTLQQTSNNLTIRQIINRYYDWKISSNELRTIGMPKEVLRVVLELANEKSIIQVSSDTAKQSVSGIRRK